MKHKRKNIIRTPSVIEALEHASKVTGKPIGLIVQPIQSKFHIDGRTEVIKYLRDNKKFSFPRIGKLLGGYDRTSIEYLYYKSKGKG